jgi:hypothetical protein
MRNAADRCWLRHETMVWLSCTLALVSVPGVPSSERSRGRVAAALDRTVRDRVWPGDDVCCLPVVRRRPRDCAVSIVARLAPLGSRSSRGGPETSARIQHRRPPQAVPTRCQPDRPPSVSTVSGPRA